MSHALVLVSFRGGLFLVFATAVRAAEPFFMFFSEHQERLAARWVFEKLNQARKVDRCVLCGLIPPVSIFS